MELLLKPGGTVNRDSSFVPPGNVYIHGDTSRVHDIVMAESFKSTEQVGIKFSGALAYRAKTGELHSRLVDTVMELRNDRIWLNYRKDFWDGNEIKGATLLGIGVSGKYVLGRYWKFIGKGCPWDRNTSEVAYFIAFIPEIKNGKMIGKARVEYNVPENGDFTVTPGVLSRTMYYVQKYYNSDKIIMRGGRTIESLDLIQDERESPLFSLGVPLFPFFEETLPEIFARPLLSSTVGITSEQRGYSLLAVTVSPDSREVEYQVKHYKSPAIFQYRGKYCRISTMFLDIYFPENNSGVPGKRERLRE